MRNIKTLAWGSSIVCVLLLIVGYWAFRDGITSPAAIELARGVSTNPTAPESVSSSPAGVARTDTSTRAPVALAGSDPNNSVPASRVPNAQTVLEIEARLAGDGAMLAGASIYVRVDQDAATESDSLLAESDDTGAVRVVLPVLPQTTRSEIVIVGRRGPLTGTVSIADLSFGETRRVVVELARGVEVPGRVTDALTGAALSGVRVCVETYDPSDVVVTDGSGRFVLEAFPIGDGHTLKFRLDGYAQERMMLSVGKDGGWWQQPASFEDRDSSTTQARPWPATLEVRMQPSRSIVGQVVDGAMKPIKGATVSAHGYYDMGDGVAFSDVEHAKSDADGVFHLAQLRGDVVHIVDIDAEGFASACIPVACESTGPRDVGVVRLDVDHRIEGVLIDSEERRVAGVVVSVAAKDWHPDRRWDRSSCIRDFERSIAFRRETIADETGFFRVAGLPPGTYVVRARSIDGRELDEAGWTVESQPSNVEHTHDFRATGSWSHLTGHVLADGIALGRAIVVVSGTSVAARVRTDSSGAFALGGVIEGQEYEMWAFALGGDGSRLLHSSRIDVVGGTEDVRLELVTVQ